MRKRPCLETLEARLTPDVTFAVIGDYGADTTQERDVANLVASWNPDFVVTTGDNGYDTTAANIDRFIGQYYHGFIGDYQGVYGQGAAVNQFFPSAGNHDWNGGGDSLAPYTDYFTLPGNERYYDVVRGDVHLFIVSSDPREPDRRSPDSVQGQWLQAGLAASAAAWQIVVLHHPPYSSGANHGSELAMRWPFQQWGADAVLAGHDHTYERILRTDALNNRFPYFVNGAGGNPTLYSFATPVTGSQVRYSADWGAQRVTASATQMTFEFLSRAGQVIDSYTITNALEVSVTATDAGAAEPGGDTGAFTVWRTGSMATPLTVAYTLSGTATNGSDYANLGTTVTISAGSAAASAIVTPLADALREPSETVMLTLAAGAYPIGTPSQATVTLTDPRADIVGRVPQTGEVFVGTSTGTRLTTALAATWNPAVAWVDVQSGDLDGDGYTDLLGRVASSGEWWASLSDRRAGFFTTLWGRWSPLVQWTDVRLGDLDGDGRADLIGRVATTGEWWASLSTGTALATSLWGRWSASAAWVDVRVGDLSGDSKADVVGRVPASGEWWVGVSTGSSLRNERWGRWNPGVSWVDVQFGDLTGDGKSDLLGRASASGQWWAAVSTGTALRNELWATWNPALAWVDVRIGDLDGDGRADILGRVAQTGEWWAGVSTGTAFTLSRWATWNPAVVWVDVLLADLTGDGKADLIARASASGEWWVGVSDGVRLNVSLWERWSPLAGWSDVRGGDFG